MDKTVGSILKDARQLKNISLDDASKYTKIHTNILKSIENDDFKALGAIYAKSFLRLYAEYLGLDKDDIVRRFRIATGEPETMRKSRMVSEKTSSTEGAGVLKFNFLSEFFSKINFKLVFGIVLSLFIVFGFTKMLRGCNIKKSVVIAPAEVKKAVVKKQPVSPEIVAESLRLAEVKRVSAPKLAPIVALRPALVVVPSEEPVVPKEKEKLVLVVRAREKCWIKVTVDGSLVFTGALKKMTSDTWQAKEKIELWLGNAGAVDLEFNGKFLGKIGRSGQVIKRAVLTRSGLSIKK